jgi:hypothetical protein
MKGDSGAAGFCILETVHKLGGGGGGVAHAGLVRFVLVDKEMDRFYLEESLYTAPIPIPPRERRKRMISAPC